MTKLWTEHLANAIGKEYEGELTVQLSDDKKTLTIRVKDENQYWGVEHGRKIYL